MSKGKVWCYFCNKSFEDEGRLISHQKAIHFRCPICRRVRGSTSQLSTHFSSVHKQILEKVPSAIEGRDSPNNAVFGMKGIPENVYVSWLTSVDPDFKARAKDVNLEGAFFGSDATRLASRTHHAIAAAIPYTQFNQFHRASVQVNQGMGTIVTAKGVVASDSLPKETKRSVPEDAAGAQRRYDLAMRKARELVDEAIHQGVRERKQRVKAEKKTEVLYFQPVDGLSVFEMRARFLMEQRALAK
jgi:hypothetical protein